MGGIKGSKRGVNIVTVKAHATELRSVFVSVVWPRDKKWTATDTIKQVSCAVN